jgi:hypothetical protein
MSFMLRVRAGILSGTPSTELQTLSKYHPKIVRPDAKRRGTRLPWITVDNDGSFAVVRRRSVNFATRSLNILFTSETVTCTL